MKTLIIILGQTRAYELTYENIKNNLIDRLNADLALCITVKQNYNYDNPFYQNAKYKFIYNEPNDYNDAFEYASEDILKNNKLSKYEKIENTNILNNKIYHKTIPNTKCIDENITFLGDNEIDINNLDYNEIVHFNNNFKLPHFKNTFFGIDNQHKNTPIIEKNVDLYKKRIHWSEFKKLKNNFFGGVKNNKNYPIKYGTAGIRIFLHWFLLKNIQEQDIINQYDRFIITRSDFIYKLPHPQIELFDENYLYFPDAEFYKGLTDRHVILSKLNIKYYLNIFENMVIHSSDYLSKIQEKNLFNFEQLIRFNIEYNKMFNNVKLMPYIMNLVRNINGPSDWQYGWLSEDNKYFIKYYGEQEKSNFYKKKFNESNQDINSFYQNLF